MEQMEIQPTVSVLAEIDESLHIAMLEFLNSRKDYDFDRLFAASLSLFLMQNGTGSVNSVAAKAYLDCLFRGAV